jgi:signal transduction histidine kinase
MMAPASVVRIGEWGDGEAGTSRGGNETFRLLLVEDNPADADLACERLSAVSDYRIELTSVTNLHEAVEVLREQPIDAVLLDLSLPDSTGLETLRKLHAIRDDVAIVVLAGGVTDELRRLALREGAEDFIGKDEPPAVLLARLMPSVLERHRAQEPHRQVERLVAADPDAVLVTDAKGIVQFVNPAATRLFARRRDDFIGRPLGYPIDEAGVSEISLHHGEETLWGEMRCSACEWGGNPAYLVTIRDITERKLLSEQLRQAQKMEAVGLLAGGIAHDFNNLLLVILFYAEFLRDRIDESDPRRSDVTEILRAVERAQGLTSQLLAFSRRRPVKPRVIDLNEIVIGIRKLLQRTFPSCCEIVSLTPEEIAPIRADAGQVEQLLMNLAVNARDAMPEGGRFTIEVAHTRLDKPTQTLAPGRYVALRVSDTGHGIAAEHLKRIFEPFFTTKEPGKGTGLGLATCYGIARQAGGDITVQSELGSGTTFTILFPHCDAIPAEAHEARRPAERLDGTETILVVEDHPAVLRSTSRILRQHGYAVLTATNGEQALRVIDKKGGSIDLVLTDIVMPQMTGTELVERLDISHPHLNVLFVTGYRDQALGRDNWVDADRPILYKPYPPRELLRKVREVLDLAQHRGVSARAG